MPLGSLTYHFSSLEDLRAQAFQRHAERMSVIYAAHFEAVETHEQLVEAVTGRRGTLRAGYIAVVAADSTAKNLTVTLAEFGLDLAQNDVDRLNQARERLPPWADSVEGLSVLKQRYIIGPLSNGDTALLTRMAKHAGLPWDVIIGADLTQRYKPHPEAYLRIAAILDLPPNAVMLVAAHNDDLAAARQAGLATGFIPRRTEHGPDQKTDLQAEADWELIADDLIDVAQQLIAGPRDPRLAKS